MFGWVLARDLGVTSNCVEGGGGPGSGGDVFMKTDVQITRINLVIHINYVTVHHVRVLFVHVVVVIVSVFLVTRTLLLLVIVTVESSVTVPSGALC